MTKESFSDVLVTKDLLPAAKQVVIDFCATNVQFTDTASWGTAHSLKYC